MLQISTADLPNMHVLLFFTTLVLWWAMVRPSMVRDYDNRRLVANPTARIIFAILCLALYAAIVVAFQASGNFADQFANKISFLHPLKAAFKDQAPLLAAFTLGSLMQLNVFREVERSVLVRLHSARDLHADLQELAVHLARTTFEPSAEENYKNRDSAAKYGVYITETNDANNLVTFGNWRKVSSLVRLVKDWNSNTQRVLTQDDMDQLAELETSHERKTQLAMNIIKMVDKVSANTQTRSPLPGVVDTISETSHHDRAQVADAEQKMSNLLSGDEAMSTEHPAHQIEGYLQQPLRLSGEEFVNHLHQIEGYFRVEYETLMQRASQLAAKSVVQAGENAPQRLETLRAIGFSGLGRIEPIDFNRILWLLLIVLCGGFLVLFLGNFGEKYVYSPIGMDALARLLTIATIATLVGALIGSNRHLANSASTPWIKFVSAGLFAAIAFLAVQSTSGLVKSYIAKSEEPRTAVEQSSASQTPAGKTTAEPKARSGQKKRLSVFSIEKTIPWMFMPFLLTLTICRLGFQRSWPPVPGLANFKTLTDRLIDGLIVSVLVYVAYMMTMVLHYPLDVPHSNRFLRSLTEPHIMPIPVRWPIQLLAFLVGFFVVHDVRRAAHAKIVDPNAQSDDSAGTASTEESAAGEAVSPASATA